MRRPTRFTRRVLSGIGAALLIVFIVSAYLYGPQWSVSRQKTVVIDGVVENKVVLAPRGKYRSHL